MDADGSDVRVVWRALHAMADTKRLDADVVTTIDVEDCGAAYRFLLPLLAATPGAWLLTGSARLLQRPILPLVEVLSGIGAKVERVEDGWLIHGKTLLCDGGLSLTLDASQSSQMASALVLAAPLLGLRTLHLTTTEIPSLSYLRMTLALTRDRPVVIPGIDVPDTSIGAPGDWSAALFWFAHARLHPENEYCLSPLSLESIQGDSVIAKWFRKLNVAVLGENATSPCINIVAKPLRETPRMVLDVRDNLDTVPVMAALAALLPADLTFLNVQNLRYKESDRLQALADQLAPYAEIELSDNDLRVKGKGEPIVAGAGLDTKHDHRLAMAFLLFPGAVLDDAGCLEKSYPGLIKQM
jgi:3-phosphoshikimate 1-carboxyvinyltransferase